MSRNGWIIAGLLTRLRWQPSGTPKAADRANLANGMNPCHPDFHRELRSDSEVDHSS